MTELNNTIWFRQNKSFFLFIGVCGAILVLLFSHERYVKDQLNAWKLLPQPEKITELYFTKPNNLPTSYSSNQTEVTMFTVHNSEYRTVRYSYKIIEQSVNSKKTVQLAQGEFTLFQNQYKRLDSMTRPADLGNNAEIKVELLNVNESVDYFVARSNS
jgi:hypothetical protein